MKKFFIIAGVALLVGAVMMLSGMTILDWDFYALDSAEYTQLEYEIQNDVSEIELTMELGRIKIVRGSKLKIVYHESERETTDITETEDKLVFNQLYESMEGINIGFFRLKKASRYTEIHIPSSMSISLTAETKNSQIEAASAGEFEFLSLKTTNSKINASNITAKSELTLESTNGEIDLVKSTAQNVKIDTTNNDIEISDITANNLELKTTNNDICIKKVSCETLDARTTNGDIEAERVAASVSIKLVASNNEIEIEKIQAPDIHLETKNGKISGTIVGYKYDYNIDAKTTNGHSNLSNETSKESNTLYVRTTNAKIEIHFDHD